MMTMLEKAAVALMNRQRNRYGLSSIDIGMFDPEEIERAKYLSRAVLMAVRGEVCDSVVIEFIDEVIGERPTEKNY